MSVDWPAIRELYPALRDRTFLNTATFGQLSRLTVEAMTRHFQHRDELACSDFLGWFEDHDRLREKLARLIRAEASDIAFLPNSNAGLAILMHSIDWREGDEILTLEGEFPNNIYAPAYLSSRGVKLVEAPWPALLESISERTRLVAVSSVNYTTGFRVPLDQLSAALQGRDIRLYVDATQMLGAVRFDFSSIQPDVLAVNCYKWMLAPNGVGFMAVHPRQRARMEPLAIGWRSHHDWRNVDNLHLGTPVLVDTSEKYEGGMLPSALLYGLEASVDLMLELGPQTIEERVLDLASKTRSALRSTGAEPLPFDNTAIVAARLPGRDASVVARALKQKGVLVSARHGLLRVSTHFYNDEQDIEQLIDSLKSST
ncbi:aminotransferase class V-fold PLP-dependent enzyme [uncultured Paludibaculum sp.]|uniref:aminotransferase class V-fold PLP-dependent enzyme n=1 Tax=uncultured Paludibaculum sp. TaxID=1765020 RepID=UPI002AAAA46A|nr:aminotransferase class V-fold PLP-dependent enzyme [uncultured Paludibaculum sp.]